MKVKFFLFMLASISLLTSCNSKKAEYDPYNIGEEIDTTKVVSKGVFEVEFKDAGNYTKIIHVKLNDAAGFDALFDTGCSYVSISQIEAAPLIKAGTLSESDYSGKDIPISIADGTTGYKKVYKLKAVSVIDTKGQVHTLYDVPTTIEANPRATFLLGTYVIDNLAKKSYTVDLKKSVIRFE